jgi:hypothetical protein
MHDIEPHFLKIKPQYVHLDWTSCDLAREFRVFDAVVNRLKSLSGEVVRNGAEHAKK